MQFKNIEGTLFEITENEISLLERAFYVKRDGDRVVNNSAFPFNPNQTAMELRDSEIVPENKHRIIGEMVCHLAEVFGKDTTEFAISDTDEGTHLFCHLRLKMKSSIKMENKGTARNIHHPFISLYFDYLRRTMSIKGTVSTDFKPYRKHYDSETEFTFIPYHSAHNGREVRGRYKIYKHILSQFTEAE